MLSSVLSSPLPMSSKNNCHFKLNSNLNTSKICRYLVFSFWPTSNGKLFGLCESVPRTKELFSLGRNDNNNSRVEFLANFILRQFILSPNFIFAEEKDDLSLQ